MSPESMVSKIEIAQDQIHAVNAQPAAKARYTKTKVLPGREEIVFARIISESLTSCSEYVARWAVDRGAE